MRRMYSKKQIEKIIGGGLPEVTSADNEKVLEVIAGAWSKGGKKVNVIDAPSSTTLTDELIEIIKGGVFINGDFLGFKNPIIYPLHNWGYGTYGSAIAGVINNQFHFKIININSSKVASVLNVSPLYFYIDRPEAGAQITNLQAARINNKVVPEYPANTGTFTLKCVDGVLTWVQDV